MDKQSGITLVALGPGHPDLLTVGAMHALRQAGQLVLRTDRHGVAAYLRAEGVAFDTLDGLYADSEDFDALCARAARSLLDRLAQGDLCYAASDPCSDATVAALLSLLPEGTPITALPGVTLDAAAHAGALAHRRSASGWRVTDALSLGTLTQDPTVPLIVTELGSALLAAETKLWLLERYPADTTVYFAAPQQTAGCALTPLPLAELDRQSAYDHTAALWVPAVDYRQRERFGFEDLVRIMGVLRGPGGCPWDREQTHETLRPYLIEEAYEAVDAIDSGDSLALADELGDVLLQVVFHAEVARQHADFDIADVTTAICHKMITRHAHIFGDAHCATAQDVLVSWDKIKQKERGQTTQGEVLRSVPKYLPALMRAAKVQKKAANVGFDWDRAQGALAKVYEEADELRAELEKGASPDEEAGDLLFAAVNALRLAGVQPELALSAATEKFITRFAKMEAVILADGGDLSRMTLPEMDVYWAKIKQLERS